MNLLQTFINPKRNIDLSVKATSWFYAGFILIFISIYGLVDPGTYDADIRYSRAKEKYDKIDMAVDDDWKILDSYYNLERSKKSPFGRYVVFFFMGLVTAIVATKFLNKIEYQYENEEMIEDSKK